MRGDDASKRDIHVLVSKIYGFMSGSTDKGFLPFSACMHFLLVLLLKLMMTKMFPKKIGYARSITPFQNLGIKQRHIILRSIECMDQPPRLT